jgi:hypothetical protein
MGNNKPRAFGLPDGKKEKYLVATSSNEEALLMAAVFLKFHGNRSPNFTREIYTNSFL